MVIKQLKLKKINFLTGKIIGAGLATKGLAGAGVGVYLQLRHSGLYIGLILLLINIINSNSFADCSTEIASEEVPETLDWKDKVFVVAIGIAIVYLLFFHSRYFGSAADASAVASPSSAPNSSPIVVQFSEAPADVQAFAKNAFADSKNYEPKTIEELGQTGTDFLKFMGKK